MVPAELRSLEHQIEAFIRSLAIDRDLEAWVLDELARDVALSKEVENAQKRSLEKSLGSVEEQLNELTGLRLRNLLTDAEFVAQRAELQKECLRLREKIAASGQTSDRFEPMAEVISFSNRAADWFAQGDDQSKRLILETVGSNPILSDRILRIQAKKPFVSVPQSAGLCTVLGVVDDVRTNNTKCDMVMRIAHEVRQSLDNEDGKRILANIRTLRETFEPEVVAKEDALKARQAKAAARACRARGAYGSFRQPLPW